MFFLLSNIYSVKTLFIDSPHNELKHAQKWINNFNYGCWHRYLFLNLKKNCNYFNKYFIDNFKLYINEDNLKFK